MSPQQRGCVTEILPAAPRGIDGRLEQQAADEPRGLLKMTGEFRIDLGIVAGKARKLRLCLLHVIAEDDVIIATQRAKQVVGRKDLQAVSIEVEVADHPWVEQAHDI